jgi:hypothetical protein
MEFGHPLQLAFNLISITAITSLALFCVLLNRDKNKLITELHRQRNQDRRQPSVNGLKEEAVREASRPAAREANPAVDQDIRQFVARRIDGWIARS